jgi:hypothetical protein
MLRVVRAVLAAATAVQRAVMAAWALIDEMQVLFFKN